MIRRTQILSILFVLLALLATPVVAQDDTSSAPEASASTAATAIPVASAAPSTAPSQPPLPTAIPVSDGPLAQSVLFFSPTCGHCHYVITETLPPLFAQNGGEPLVTFDQSVPANEVTFYLMSNGRVQVLLVDVTQPAGQAMFTADSIRLGIDQAGVPRLDIEDDYLVGSGDIPDQFPDLVARALEREGMAWPDVPGLDEVLAPFAANGAVPDPAATPEPQGSGSPDASAAPDGAAPTPHDPFAVIPVGEEEDVFDKVARDPLGNGLAIVVLIVLVLSLVAAPLLAARGALPAFPDWLIIVLAAVGLVVAAYLANVETSGNEAVCGPVGDCNAVQESEYAKLFGIPVGVLGIIGYAAIGVLWLVSRVAKGALADWALVLIALGAFGGSLFSVYLTFLEPFVIGATCMWCITSAVVMVALLWVSAGPGWAAWRRRRST